jgi:hypothetical protein
MEMPDGQSIDWIWGIQGFDERYQWGTRYVLELRRKQIANAPTDAPSTRYELAKVVRAEPVPAGTRFRLPLRSFRDVYVRYDEDTEGHTLLNEVEIVMRGALTAPRVWAAASMYPEATGTFSFRRDRRLDLVDIRGEFDLQTAMDSYIQLFGEPGEAELSQWGEKRYAERFAAYYAERFAADG